MSLNEKELCESAGSSISLPKPQKVLIQSMSDVAPQTETTQCPQNVASLPSNVLAPNDPNPALYTQWNVNQMISWIVNLENGRFKGYINALRKGFIEGEMNGDDLPTVEAKDLSDPPFNIKRFRDKKDLAKYFQDLATSKEQGNDRNEGIEDVEAKNATNDSTTNNNRKRSRECSTIHVASPSPLSIVDKSYSSQRNVDECREPPTKRRRMVIAPERPAFSSPATDSVPQLPPPQNATDDVIPQHAEYSISNASDIATSNNNVLPLNHRRRILGDSKLKQLSVAIMTVLRECKEPVCVLTIRRQLQSVSGTVPQVRKMNKILYEQERTGKLIKHRPAPDGRNSKPLWSLSQPPS